MFWISKCAWIVPGKLAKIGLSLEIIEIDKAKNERAPGKAEARGYPAVMVSDYTH